MMWEEKQVPSFLLARYRWNRHDSGMVSIADQLLQASAFLADEMDSLSFSFPVAYTYNPLKYAWAPYEQYVRRYGDSKKRTFFLGMNPGPFGMAQTGVPFGEVDAVKNWLGIEAAVGKPSLMHPKRPVDGFACKRSEVSGRRLWGLFRDVYGTPETFFKDHFVVNFCPLVWMSESGANVTPDKLSADIQECIDALCLSHLESMIRIMEPEILVGVGAYATNKLKDASSVMPDRTFTIGTLLHPSPASPVANKFWPQRPMEQLRDLGILPVGK